MCVIGYVHERDLFVYMHVRVCTYVCINVNMYISTCASVCICVQCGRVYASKYTFTSLWAWLSRRCADQTGQGAGHTDGSYQCVPWNTVRAGAACYVHLHMHRQKRWTVIAYKRLPVYTRAQPPVGNLRFQPTERIEAWAPSTLKATAYKPDCMQSLVHNAGMHILIAFPITVSITCVDVSPHQHEDW
jgi:hypothetical protein